MLFLIVYFIAFVNTAEIDYVNNVLYYSLSGQQGSYTCGPCIGSTPWPCFDGSGDIRCTGATVKYVHFYSQGSSLNGTLPPDISQQLPSLECTLLAPPLPPYPFNLLLDLELRSNEIHGTLPPLPNSLRWLQLANNFFEGTLKNDHFQYMGNLIQLRMGQNQFEGSLPQLYPWSLTLLDAYNNKFSGSIPTQWPSSLTSIHLDRNRFSGTINIPTSLTLTFGCTLMWRNGYPPSAEQSCFTCPPISMPAKCNETVSSDPCDPSWLSTCVPYTLAPTTAPTTSPTQRPTESPTSSPSSPPSSSPPSSSPPSSSPPSSSPSPPSSSGPPSPPPGTIGEQTSDGNNKAIDWVTIAIVAGGGLCFICFIAVVAVCFMRQRSRRRRRRAGGSGGGSQRTSRRQSGRISRRHSSQHEPLSSLTDHHYGPAPFESKTSNVTGDTYDNLAVGFSSKSSYVAPPANYQHNNNYSSGTGQQGYTTVGSVVQPNFGYAAATPQESSGEYLNEQKFATSSSSSSYGALALTWQCYQCKNVNGSDDIVCLSCGIDKSQSKVK